MQKHRRTIQKMGIESEKDSPQFAEEMMVMNMIMVIIINFRNLSNF